MAARCSCSSAQVPAPATTIVLPDLEVEGPVSRRHQHGFVIPPERVEPGFVPHPFQQLPAVRAPVDQITECNQAIRRRIEGHNREEVIQQRGVAVDVAHDEIPAPLVERHVMKQRVQQHL